MTPPSQQQPDLKQRTARTIKWNVVDKVATQVLYAATGIVLMRELSREAFGLVGAVLVVQAFALMFVDSGFASALIQRKDPDNRDYSTVFWFNICISVLIYTLLWFAAPLIADWFHDDRLVTLSRAMFLTVLLSALGIVQTNRMVKRMNVRPVTVANVAGLALGSAVGIYLAFTRGDAWALVWQSVVTTGAKSLLLWVMVRWIPAPVFSWSRLRSFFKVGAGVMAGAFLNNVFQNIYGIFIGNRVGMLSLAYYSQADKWSKMGTASLSGVLTSSFLPTLSEVQDSPERLIRATRKMNRFTAYLLFFGFGWLIAAATPVFHLLSAKVGCRHNPVSASAGARHIHRSHLALQQLHSGHGTVTPAGRGRTAARCRGACRPCGMFSGARTLHPSPSHLRTGTDALRPDSRIGPDVAAHSHRGGKSDRLRNSRLHH